MGASTVRTRPHRRRRAGDGRRDRDRDAVTRWRRRSGGADSAASERTAALEAAASDVPEIAAPFATEDAANGEGDGAGGTTFGVDDDEAVEEDFARDSAEDALFAERSPWPMVLFAGIALMIGAALLRWILVPRAG